MHSLKDIAKLEHFRRLQVVLLHRVIVKEHFKRLQLALLHRVIAKEQYKRLQILVHLFRDIQLPLLL